MKTSKRQKIEVEGELVEVPNTEGKKKQMKVKGPAFEVKEYDFFETNEGSTDQFKTRDELFDKYKDSRDTSLDESLKLYTNVSLDH